MISQWQWLRGPLLLVLASVGVFVAAFAVRLIWLPDVLPLAATEEAQPLWAFQAAFMLKAIENIAALGLVLVLAAVAAQWAARAGTRARIDLHQS
jgi:hypothetical protein